MDNVNHFVKKHTKNVLKQQNILFRISYHDVRIERLNIHGLPSRALTDIANA